MWLLTGVLLSAAALASAQVLPSAQSVPANSRQLGTIRGRVTGAAGQPLRKAEITLQAVRSGPGGTNYVATSAADGSFAFENIPAGQYRASASRHGYVTQSYGSGAGDLFGAAGTLLTVAAGQPLDHIDFKLVPHAVLTGKITEEDGEPAENIRVSLLREFPGRGAKQLFPANSQGVTNDLGEFRISGIAPGKYYLCANWDAFEGGGGPMRERVVRQGPEETMPQIYFPGTLDQSQAREIEIAPGAQMQGFDLQLQRVRAFRISGRVVVPDDADVDFVMTQLMPRMDGRRGIVMGGGGPMVGADGVFEIGGVVPGSYDLLASCNVKGRSLQARVPVEVKDRNLEGIVVTFKSEPGVAIEGLVRAASRAPDGFNPSGIQVSLRNTENAESGAGAQSARNGAFTLQNVAPGRYEVSVYAAPEDGYLKSVRYLEQESADRIIDVAPGSVGARLEVLLAFDGGEAGGTVEDAAGAPVPGAAVFLDPKAGAKCNCGRMAGTDQNGRYQLRGIPPGEYLLFAVSAADLQRSWGEDFRAQHETQGISLTVTAGGRFTLKLKLIPTDK